jgi:hypothetical protein
MASQDAQEQIVDPSASALGSREQYVIPLQ